MGLLNYSSGGKSNELINILYTLNNKTNDRTRIEGLLSNSGGFGLVGSHADPNIVIDNIIDRIRGRNDDDKSSMLSHTVVLSEAFRTFLEVAGQQKRPVNLERLSYLCQLTTERIRDLSTGSQIPSVVYDNINYQNGRDIGTKGTGLERDLIMLQETIRAVWALSGGNPPTQLDQAAKMVIAITDADLRARGQYTEEHLKRQADEWAKFAGRAKDSGKRIADMVRGTALEKFYEANGVIGERDRY